MSLDEVKVFGNNKQNKLLLECFSREKCPQAWLIYGDKGLGKFFSINKLVNTYKQKNPLSSILVLNENENQSNIEDIRLIISQLSLTNNSRINDKTFVLIDNADQMSFNSHNALLKTLEEPPKNTLIILIVHNFKKIPKTVISRCSLVKFERLSFLEFKHFIKENFEKYPPNMEEIFKVTNGFPKYINLFKNEDGEKIKEITKNLIEDKQFNHSLFQILYKLVEKDFDKNIYLVMTIVFNSVKTKILELSNKKTDKVNNILIFLEELKIYLSDNILIDNKKKLHYVFFEYYNLFKSI